MSLRDDVTQPVSLADELRKLEQKYTKWRESVADCAGYEGSNAGDIANAADYLTYGTILEDLNAMAAHAAEQPKLTSVWTITEEAAKHSHFCYHKDSDEWKCFCGEVLSKYVMPYDERRKLNSLDREMVFVRFNHKDHFRLVLHGLLTSPVAPPPQEIIICEKCHLSGYVGALCSRCGHRVGDEPERASEERRVEIWFDESPMQGSNRGFIRFVDADQRKKEGE